MNNKPIVSIIVPVYNVEHFLLECLDSIICQTYNELDIILVDDGSTDNSSTICDEFSLLDSRVQVIHQKNTGLSCARNAGLDIAKGKFVMFVDSDDVIHLQMVEIMVKSALFHNATCVTAQCFRFNFDQKPVFSTLRESIHQLLLMDKALEYVLMNKTHIGVTSKLFDRTAFQNIRFAPGEINEDLNPITVFMARQKRVVALNDRFYAYRRNRPGSITGSIFNRKKLCVINHLDEMYEFVENTFPHLLRAAKYLCLMTSLDMANNAGAYYFSSQDARAAYKIFRGCFIKYFYWGFLIESHSWIIRCKTLILFFFILTPIIFSGRRFWKNCSIRS